jgi:hypothetical protein
MEITLITVAVIVAFVVGVLVGFFAGFRFACKRFTFDDAERFANRHDGGREREAILDGIATLQKALAEAGFNPR